MTTTTTTQSVPLAATQTITRSELTVSSSFAGNGQSVGITDASTVLEVLNASPRFDCWLRVDSGPWRHLEPTKTSTFDVDLSTSTVYLKKGEFADNLPVVLYINGPLPSGGGASTFTALSDAPSSYTGNGGKAISVKNDESGLEIACPAVRVATVTLTDAQIKALATTPVEIVPALGAGRAVMMLRTFAILDFTGGAYVMPGGLTHFLLQLMVGDGNGYQVDAVQTSDIAWVMTSASQRYWVSFSPGRLNVGNPWPSVNTVVDTTAGNDVPDNVPLFLGGSFDSGEQVPFTGGNAANTLKVTVAYIVIDL